MKTKCRKPSLILHTENSKSVFEIVKPNFYATCYFACARNDVGLSSLWGEGFELLRNEFSLVGLSQL